jgi:hypothetical protein
MSAFDHDHSQDDPRLSRRKVLECMTWAGTGVLWSISGGVPHALGLIDSAQAAEPTGLTFLQISDSHIGFDKPRQPQRHRHARGSHRPDQSHAGEAVVHDPYRRY